MVRQNYNRRVDTFWAQENVRLGVFTWAWETLILFVCRQQAPITAIANDPSSLVDCDSILCVWNNSSLTIGAYHELAPLEELVKILNKDIYKLKAEMTSKEELLEKLFKHTSKIVSEFDLKTSKLLEKLHSTRDEQVYPHENSKVVA